MIYIKNTTSSWWLGQELTHCRSTRNVCEDAERQLLPASSNLQWERSKGDRMYDRIPWSPKCMQPPFLSQHIIKGYLNTLLVSSQPSLYLILQIHDYSRRQWLCHIFRHICFRNNQIEDWWLKQRILVPSFQRNKSVRKIEKKLKITKQTQIFSNIAKI